jgi:hypothetical protein
MTEHQVSGQVMRQLVNRGCGKPVPRMQTPDEARCEQHRAVVMDGGIPKVCGDGIPTILRVNAL